MMQSPFTTRATGRILLGLIMVAIGSALANPAHAQSEIEVPTGRQLATVHCSRCHAIDDERFILKPGALPLRELKLRYPAEASPGALAASLRRTHFDLSAILSREETAALLNYLNSLW
jgi:mono/diheme cytochrome c family protein